MGGVDHPGPCGFKIHNEALGKGGDGVRRDSFQGRIAGINHGNPPASRLVVVIASFHAQFPDSRGPGNPLLKAAPHLFYLPHGHDRVIEAAEDPLLDRIGGLQAVFREQLLHDGNQGQLHALAPQVQVGLDHIPSPS